MAAATGAPASAMHPQTYPTNQLMGVIDDPAVAERAVDALLAAAFRPADVTLMTPASEQQPPRPWTRIVRIFQFMSMDQGPDFHYYEAAVREGRAVVTVRVRGRARMEEARDILQAHGAHFLNYFGRFQTEEISPWRGPEPHISEYLKR
jgi:hypothetical protein